MTPAAAGPGRPPAAPLRAGIACLIFAYVLSQFFRAFLAVLSPALTAEIGATAEDLAAASGLWFLAFAVLQIPVGAALDRLGPCRTAAWLLGVGAIGAAVFALAEGPNTIKLAMMLIGVGCSPVLMASYYIFAREFPPAVFGTFAGAVIGIGSLGNIASALPLAWAADSFGWRATVAATAALTLATALAIRLTVRDPSPVPGAAGGSLFQLLRMRALWPVLAMMAVCYAPAAGIRGLWIGPYLRDVFGAGTDSIGRATLCMGLAMVAGSFAYGPLDRLFGTRKGVILVGNLGAAACLVALWQAPAASGWAPVALLSGLGFFGASFAMVIAHGRAFLPPHLVGRGVTLLNLFGVGSVGVMQVVTGAVFAAAPQSPAEAPFSAVFLLFAVLLLAGLALYLFSQDRTD